MSATNTTPNYNLSQFIETDKPAWLQDYNGDMLKIDTGINAAKVAADNAASAAGNAQTDATSALNQLGTLSTTVSSLVSTVGTAVGNINTINSLIGNGTPTTTDQTIIGAINELHADIAGAMVMFVDAVTTEITADGVKTYSQLSKELYDQFIADLSAEDASIRYQPFCASFDGSTFDVDADYFFSPSDTRSLWFNYTQVTATEIYARSFLFSNSSGFYRTAIIDGNGTTFTDKSSVVPAAGSKLQLLSHRAKLIS